MRHNSVGLLVLLLRIRFLYSFIVGASRKQPFLIHGARLFRWRQPSYSVYRRWASRSPQTTTENSTAEYTSSSITSGDNWSDHPDLNPVLTLDTWLVPSRHVQSVLGAPQLQPLLANINTPYNGRSKIRLVQPHNETHQLVLYNSSGSTTDDVMHSLRLQQGPSHALQLNASYFSLDDILSVLSIPSISQYEQVGHVLLLQNLSEQHEAHLQTIGDICLSTFPKVSTVAYIQVPNGDLRILAGANDTIVTVVEHGVSLSFDLKTCHDDWNVRLAGERSYMLHEEFAHVQENTTIANVACGVGMQPLLFATQLSNVSTVYANNVNARAIQALDQAAKKHHVDNRVVSSCGDPYDFLMEMGLEWDTPLPHYIILMDTTSNNEAVSWLNALRWWRIPKRKKRHVVVPTLYVYVAIPSGSGTTREMLEYAIDTVAHNLLPEGPSVTPNRTSHLNQLGCRVEARRVKNGGMVCVRFQATAQLLRHMQGDYV